MDLSSIFQLCSFAVAHQLRQKRTRRAAQLRRSFKFETLEDRRVMDAAADYANALAAAQATYNGDLASEDAAWQTTAQGALNTFQSQLATLSNSQATFDAAAKQDIANAIANAATTEQNSDAAADQQLATNNQAADAIQQQQIQQAQANQATQDAALQGPYNTLVSNQTSIINTALTNDQNTFNSTMATDRAQHDSTVNSDLAAVQSTAQTDLNQASASDATIQANLQSQLNAAAASRNATINGATPSVDPATATANSAAFQAVASSASNSYTTNVAALQATENSNFASANALQQQKVTAASNQRASDDSTAYQNEAIAQNAANNVYNQAIAPVEATLTNTLVADQATYNSSMQSATNTYNSDMQTAANNQAANQATADANYNSAAQPLTNAYNQWLTGRTTQYNNDLQSLQSSLTSEITGEENSYANKVAGYATTENNAIQGAWGVYNNAIAGFAATQAGEDQGAQSTYNQAVNGAQGVLNTAITTYNNTINQIYQQAQQSGQPPNQGAIQAAYATLQTAYHAYANATAGAAVALQSSLGSDAMQYVTSEGPVYVTLEDAIATATGNYDTSVASAQHTEQDNEADDSANADSQAANIIATYQNDVETHYEALQLQLAPLVKTREDAYSAAANQYLDDTLAAKAKLMNAQDDATQVQTKADTDAYTAYDLGIDTPWQTLQEALAQADANLVDALAKANTTYNTSVMAADIQQQESYVSAMVGYDAGVAAQVVSWVQQVAPAWASAVIAASGNNAGTTTWADAWSAYMISAASLTAGAAGQTDQVFQSTQDAIFELGTGLSSQVSAADNLLADEAGQAEVLKATNDTTAVLAYDGVVIPAGGALAKGEIDDAHSEVTAEISADKQDGIAHGNNDYTKDKAYSLAAETALQQEDPQILADDTKMRTNAAGNVATADQDEDAMIEKIDAATEKEVDDLVPDGQKEVHDEATADKVYTNAKAQAVVNQGNAQAQQTQANVAAQPDSSFNSAETIPAPGIYIAIYPGTGNIGHAEFYLPIILNPGHLTGYVYFSFAANGFNPGGNGGGGWWQSVSSTVYSYANVILGLEDGQYSMMVLGPEFDPKVGMKRGAEEYPPADWFIPSSLDGLRKMMLYATGRANNGNGDGQNYRLATGMTCVGFLIDTMDEADLFPNWAMQIVPDAFDLSAAIELILTGEYGDVIAQKLPAYSPMNKWAPPPVPW